MPGAGGTYLPPVVAELVGEIDNLARKLAEAKALLLGFSRTDATAKLGGDILPLQRSLTAAKLELLQLSKQVTSARLGADAKPFWSEIAALKAELAAMSPLKVDVDAEIGGALAKIAALRGAIALASIGGGGVSGVGGRGGEGLLTGAMLGKLLWGGGSKLPLGIPGGFGWGGLAIGGLAGMGSIGSFAGFGAEHLLMTLLGLGGSAVGGLLGGGALALGGLGTMGAGMGSDMMVAKSTLADTKSLTEAYTNLAKAQAVYGKGSRQAEIAQAQLNYRIAELGGASKIGVAAEIQLAQAAMAFNETWDRVTQAARASFVNNLALPMLQVAKGYLPLIADAATRNFGIIGTALIPLFTFLDTAGHRIFSNLEGVFARNLPISVGIFVQSLELILRTMEHIAMSPGFGSFLPKILDFVTRLNTTGFGALMGHVDNLVKLFHEWASLVAALVRDIALMFGQTAGLGESIVVVITKMLDRLGDWERSAGGQSAMHSVFSVHKDEVLALLALIPPLVVSIARIYLAIAPTLTRVATGIILILASVANFLTGLQGGSGQFFSWSIGLSLVAAKLHLLRPAIHLVIGAFQLLRVAGLSSLLSLGIVGVAILALILIGYLLATHWHQVKAVAMAVWGFIGPYVRTVLSAIGGFIKAFVAGAKAWWNQHKDEVMQVWNAIAPFVKAAVSGIVGIVKVYFMAMLVFLTAIWIAVSSVIKIAWDVIKTIFTVALDLVTGHWKRAWRDLLGGLREIAVDIVAVIKRLVGDIPGFFASLPGKLLIIGKAIIQGLIDGIKSMVGLVAKTIGDVVAKIKEVPIIGKLFGSPSPYFIEVGKAIGQGTEIGVVASTARAVAAVTKMAQQIRDAGKYQPSFGGGLRLAGAGATPGPGSITVHSSPTVHIQGGGDPQANALALQRTLDQHTANLVKALRGGVFMPGQGLP